ncbi:efflux transporter outer membrane subunit [Xanthobacter sp. AM11]|uniref:efflux transporter outer membrane subunit n=1 Tax=Xanthobacter sp. AM11 TaxID=3380643 RepID=UPI0039BF2BBB
MRDLCPLSRVASCLRGSTIAASLLLMNGCMVGPNFEVPDAPHVSGYLPDGTPGPTTSAAVHGGGSQVFLRGRDLPGEWWRVFRNKQLDAFVAEAIRNHPDIAATQAALRAARENALAGEGSLFPQVSASGSGTRQVTSLASQGESGNTSPYNLYNASVSVSYVLDVWGGTRRQVEALEAQADYQRFQLEATYLSLTANVVTAAITDASLRAQIEATNDIIQSEQEQLKLIQRQFELGAVAQSDVLSQQSNLAQTQATLPPLQKQLAQQRNQLMAYLGRLPSQDRGEHVTLASLTLPRDLPVSVPSALVRQRPDIGAAEASLHKATATVGVNVANMLPQVQLTGSYGRAGLTPDSLFSPGTAAWSLAGSVAQTVFDGGTLFHDKESAIASNEQALAQYKSTVITAFRDVADSLRAIEADASTLKAQLAYEKAAQESVKISRTQYLAGAVTYPSVLTAEQNFQQAVIARVKAQAARFTDTAALFQALGGGWWNRLDQTAQAQPRTNAGYFQDH